MTFRVRSWIVWTLVCAALAVGTKAQAINYTVLHSFAGSDGSFPNDVQLVRGGYLYGTTQAGGAHNKGTIFRLARDGTYTVLYSFSGGATGGEPRAGVTYDRSNGNLYGTTTSGGGSDYGVIYKLAANGQFAVIHSFNYDTDGGYPLGRLTRDVLGNFYGTANQGGSRGGGTAFSLTPDGTFTVLRSFGGSDGSEPTGHLEHDRAGNLYGVNTIGGSGSGTAFKLTTIGAFSVLHTFNDGVGPAGGMARDGASDLYGNDVGGGYGFVFKLTSDGTFIRLHDFSGGADGRYPVGDMLRTGAGHLYGTTARGGSDDGGTIFEITPDGRLTGLHNFAGAPNDGSEPVGNLIRNKRGVYYGATLRGGANNLGTIFRFSK